MEAKFSKKQFYWINFVWFQLVWFLAVGYNDQALYLLLLSLGLHFLVSPTKSSDLLNLLQITVIGTLVDYLLTYLGILVFTDQYFIPMWLILLWAHFSIALNHGLSWLERIPVYACILFGAIFGTLSYFAGYKMGSVILHRDLLLSLFSLSVVWAILLPIYTALASRNRMRCDDQCKEKTHHL